MKKCHWGVLQVGKKVTWSNRRGRHRGRIESFDRDRFLGMYARVRLLPLTSRKRTVDIPIHLLEVV